MSPYRPDIEDVLAFQVKKELADRYFGFRKLIEEDKLDFSEKTRQYSLILEKRIRFDLIRIHLLLQQEELVLAFFTLTGLPAPLFYDSSLTQSNTLRERVFTGVRLHGLTQAGRFKNLIFDCYERLEAHMEQYREKFEELKEYREDINVEIKNFHRNNDLGSIMGFLRQLNDPNRSGSMEGGLENGIFENLDSKMRIEPELPVEHFLPFLPPLPELNSIRPELKELSERACRHHGRQLLKILSSMERLAPR